MPEYIDEPSNRMRKIVQMAATLQEEAQRSGDELSNVIISRWEKYQGHPELLDVLADAVTLVHTIARDIDATHRQVQAQGLESL